MAIVVMGVSGSGKSTVGDLLAQRLGVRFLEGDDLHPESNIARMANREPLTDQDREPWLDAIGEWLDRHECEGVVACSALRRAYRDRLRAHCPRLQVLQLDGSADVVRRRMAAREHFMPVALLESQFATLEPLEPDEVGMVVSLDLSPHDIVERFLAGSGSPDRGRERRPGSS